MKPKVVFFILVACFVAILAGSGYGYYVALSRVRNSGEKLANKEYELQALSGQISKLQKLESETDEVRDKIGDLEELLPGEKDTDVILAQLLELARTRGVEIPGNTIGFPASGLPSDITQLESSRVNPALQSINTRFSVKGQYGPVFSFLNDLEELARLSTVSDISVSYDETTGEYLMDLTLEFFVSKKVAPPPVADAKGSETGSPTETQSGQGVTP